MNSSDSIPLQAPHPCDRIDNRCRTWLVKYDTGMKGEIRMPTQAGVRFGKGSFSYMLLQVHWNNPQLLKNNTGYFTEMKFFKQK